MKLTRRLSRAAQAKFKAQETKWEQLKAEQQKQILALKHKDTNYLVCCQPSRFNAALCDKHVQHEMRKRESEYNRLKERLRAVADNKKETAAIAITNAAPKASSSSSSRSTMAVPYFHSLCSFCCANQHNKNQPTDIMATRYENKIQSLALENQALRLVTNTSYLLKQVDANNTH